MSVATPHLREDLLAPRFYTTEVAKAARTDLDQQREAFESLLQEMEQDYNRDHFDRRASLSRLADLTAEERNAYESYLVRSCVSEFSGFLLFKELSRRLAVAGRGDLSRLFNLMARDEARHAGFLNRALLAEGLVIDLPSLSGNRTHSLTVSERSDFYQLLGLDSSRFDEDVIRQTNRTAERAFPVVYALADDRFFALRDQVIAALADLRASRAKEPGPRGVLRRLALRWQLASLLARQFFQPMVTPGAHIA